MEITPIQEKEIPKPADPIIDEMTRAGLHFGHKTSKTHPKMKPYIAGVRNTIHVLDLEKTKEKLDLALQFISGLIQEGKVILLVGTKIQLKGLVKQTAETCGFPFVSEPWIGGTFTHLDTILKRISTMLDLEKKRETGELDKYTKKKKLRIDGEIKELEEKYGGLRTLAKLPDAVFICDLDQNQLALKEAKRKGIAIISVCDTNIDPTPVDYLIPANDDAVSSAAYVLDKVKETIL